MKHIKNFADFVNESIQSQDINEGKNTGKEEIKKLEKSMSDMQDALNNANWKDLEKHAEKAKWWAHVLNSFKFESTNESKQLETINESTVSNNIAYEIATPASTSSLIEEILDLMGPKFTYIRNFNSPDELESIIAFNLSSSDIKKIKQELDDCIIFKMDLTNRKEI